MGEFDFWQKWGLELNDQQFANAFTALGALAANGPGPGDGGLPEPPQSSDDLERALHALDLRMAISDAFRHARQNQFTVSWRFPLHNHYAKIDQYAIPLAKINPLEIAKEWETISGNEPMSKSRLRVVWYPSVEPVRPWFRLLFEAQPGGRTASILLDTGQAHLDMKWPLRLGYLPGDRSERSILRACSLWPAKELATAVRIDRDHANCDILLFNGSSGQLLKTLLETPVPQKTNLFIVRGTFEDDPATMNTRLSAIAVEGRASGFVFLDSAVTDEVLGDAVNHLIENLSHNQPFDVAVSEAFTRSYPTDPAIFLSEDLAGFQLEHVLEKIHTRLTGLKKSARLKVEPDAIERMGIPVDRTTGDVTVPENLAEKLKNYRNNINFGHESAGAFSMARMSDAIEHAERDTVDDDRPGRYLQKQIFMKKDGRFVEEKRAFLRGVPTLIRVRIGPRDEEWTALDVPFPEEKLPPSPSGWRLTVVLTEPNHMKTPLRRFIKLPKSGPSTECAFRIQPGKADIFEGRVTVLHRGRILQSGVITGRVVDGEGSIVQDDAISFADILAVRSRIDDLEDRRQFDLAFVFNHTASNDSRVVAISEKHAWVSDLKAVDKITDDLSAKFSRVENIPKDYTGGLDSKNNQAMLVDLARFGSYLYGYIVTDQLRAAANLFDAAASQYIQIVSTQSDALMPLEFIYDCEVPAIGSTLCPSWRESLTIGTCQAACTVDKGQHVCPLGFWGISKVIERHAQPPELAQIGGEYVLQSEPAGDRCTLSLSGIAVVAASRRVTADDLRPVLAACKDRFGAEPKTAKDWSEWKTLVAEYNPRVLLALPHTDGEGHSASMEIGGDAIEGTDIKDFHVYKEGTENSPLVALLGCDTIGTALEYGKCATSFRWHGASVVIGTIATVLGAHAAAVATMLVSGLKSENNGPQRLGEVIRAIKRQALLQGMLMPLCIVAFGDADWRLNGKES
jgi:hypothetical protein